MDIVSHGLWGGLAFGRKNKKSFWLSFLFGIAPDFCSFGIFTISTILGFESKDFLSSEPPFCACGGASQVGPDCPNRESPPELDRGPGDLLFVMRTCNPMGMMEVVQ